MKKILLPFMALIIKWYITITSEDKQKKLKPDFCTLRLNPYRSKEIRASTL